MGILAESNDIDEMKMLLVDGWVGISMLVVDERKCERVAAAKAGKIRTTSRLRSDPVGGLSAQQQQMHSFFRGHPYFCCPTWFVSS